MGKEFFFGIDPLDYTFRVNNPLKQRELALHLFCNLNISAKKAHQIFFESAYLFPDEYDKLIGLVSELYANQPAFPHILNDKELFAMLKGKLYNWICTHSLPNVDELSRAIEIFKFPSETLDLMIYNGLSFDLDYNMDDYIAWIVDEEVGSLTQEQLNGIRELYDLLHKGYLLSKVKYFQNNKTNTAEHHPSFFTSALTESQFAGNPRTIDVISIILSQMGYNKNKLENSLNELSDEDNRNMFLLQFSEKLADWMIIHPPPPFGEMENFMERIGANPNHIINLCANHLLDDNTHQSFKANQIKRFLDAYALRINEEIVNAMLDKIVELSNRKST
jgi:hypothetical protein